MTIRDDRDGRADSDLLVTLSARPAGVCELPSHTPAGRFSSADHTGPHGQRNHLRPVAGAQLPADPRKMGLDCQC